MKLLERQLGFTMVELLIVMGIMATLLGISMLSILSLSTTTKKEASTTLLISDIKSQQIKSMVGDTEGRGSPDSYGIIFQNNQYVLFHGESFDPDDQANFEVPIEEGFSLSSTFPDDTISFASGSGEILNFTEGQNTVTVTVTQTGEAKTVELNRLGAITDDS